MNYTDDSIINSEDSDQAVLNTDDDTADIDNSANDFDTEFSWK